MQKLPELPKEPAGRGTGCAYCEKPTTELNVKEGYAVLWDEVTITLGELVKGGMQYDQAVTKAINDHLIWVTGSAICKIKSSDLILQAFWRHYGEEKPWIPTAEKFDRAIKATCEEFESKYPGAWKCFCGHKDFEKKTKGDVAGLARKQEKQESQKMELHEEAGLRY